MGVGCGCHEAALRARGTLAIARSCSMTYSCSSAVMAWYSGQQHDLVAGGLRVRQSGRAGGRVGGLLVGVHDAAARGDPAVEQGLHQLVAAQREVGATRDGVRLVVRSGRSAGMRRRRRARGAAPSGPAA